MDEDYEEILNMPNGIFRAKYHKLSVQTIRTLRTRLTNEVFKLRRDIAHLNSQILTKKHEILQKESMINKLTEKHLGQLIKLETEQHVHIEEKANTFLLSVIGPTAFNELHEKGEFVFYGLDKRQYRIKKDGMLQVSKGKYWYNCCYLKPSQLPLPDIIASVFTTVRNSSRFPIETTDTKTNEEVSQ